MVDPIVTSSTNVNGEFWLAAAHGAVRRECRWHVAPVITETLVLDGPGGRALLVPSQRIELLESVTSDGVDVTERVRFSRSAGILTLSEGWSREVGGVEITLRHGYALDSVPEVAALIVALTKRAAQGGSVIAQQGVGPASVRYLTGADGGSLGVPLLESEKATLAPYRLGWGP